MSVCCCWYPDSSFARLLVPVVTATSIILCSNEIQNFTGYSRSTWKMVVKTRRQREKATRTDSRTNGQTDRRTENSKYSKEANSQWCSQDSTVQDQDQDFKNQEQDLTFQNEDQDVKEQDQDRDQGSKIVSWDVSSPRLKTRELHHWEFHSLVSKGVILILVLVLRFQSSFLHWRTDRQITVNIQRKRIPSDVVKT